MAVVPFFLACLEQALLQGDIIRPINVQHFRLVDRVVDNDLYLLQMEEL